VPAIAPGGTVTLRRRPNRLGWPRAERRGAVTGGGRNRCDDPAVRWLVTLSASKRDVERLAAVSLAGRSADPSDSRQLILELQDPEGDATGDDAPHAAKAVIDASVRHINGVGKLRWGRNFESVFVASVKSLDSDGHVTQRVFVEPGVEHMAPEDFAAMVERLGFPRPELPVGIEVVNAVDVAAVAALAESNPDVARVLHLIDLMLAGDHEIDWGAAYSAMEVIEQDLGSRGLSGPTLRWWTNGERERFKATANSVEALGVHARHGRRFGLAEARMNGTQGSWFVRRAAAHWMADLLSA
jgi:hypothetical protein